MDLRAGLCSAVLLFSLTGCDRDAVTMPLVPPSVANGALLSGPAILPVTNETPWRGMTGQHDVQVPVTAGTRIAIKVSGPVHVQKNPAYLPLCQPYNMCQETGHPGGDVGPGGWDYQLKVTARFETATTLVAIPLAPVWNDSMTYTGSFEVPADGVLYVRRSFMGNAFSVSDDASGYYAVENEYTFLSGQTLVVSTGPSLDCLPATVTRGQRVRCTISDLTGVSVDSWEFVGEMAVNDPTLRITESSSAGFWEGEAVETGTVTAHIYFNGAYQAITSAFTVDNRTQGWSWGPANWRYTQGAAPLCDQTRPRPGAPLHIGWNRNAGIPLNKCTDIPANRWILPDPGLNPSGGITVAAVASGPNRGRWWVTSATYRIDRASNLNPHWLPAGTLYGLSGSQGTECVNAGVATPVKVNLYIFNETCKGNDVDALIAGAWGHEGFGYAGGIGHQGAAQAAAALPENDPFRLVETVTRATQAEVYDEANNKVDGASQRISGATADLGGAVGGNSPPRQIWMWDPVPRIYVLTSVPGF